MREVLFTGEGLHPETSTFLSCLATVLEAEPEQLPHLPPGEDPATGGTVSRWLAGQGLGLARVADPGSFSWPGPWIARLRTGADDSHFVVMYGIPSGVAWDPMGGTGIEPGRIQDGFLVAAADVALARPPRPAAPLVVGKVEGIWVSAAAREAMRPLDAAEALTGRGLQGDRYVSAKGTFDSGPPGSALTLIAEEVCQSFSPPLKPNEHRRNVVTRGIDLNGLVGRDFMIGEVRCRGMRLCEPCVVVERYASRPVLRALVHRGGLRADILSDGYIRVGDSVEL